MNTIPALHTNELTTENLSTLTAKIQEFHKEMVRNPLQKMPLLPEIASRMNVSMSTFKAVFKLMYGCSPYQYYLDIKFAYAKQILRSGKYTIKEVSELVGYSQSAKFVQKFREREGQTPLRYASSYKKTIK